MTPVLDAKTVSQDRNGASSSAATVFRNVVALAVRSSIDSILHRPGNTTTPPAAGQPPPGRRDGLRSRPAGPRGRAPPARAILPSPHTLDPRGTSAAAGTDKPASRRGRMCAGWRTRAVAG